MQQPKKNFKIVPEKRSARVILPNMLTLIGVCIGLTSIRFALDGRYEFAIIAIIIAAVIDGLDGRIARLIKGTSKVGKELDSLTDMISFGVAPAFVMFFWKLNTLGRFGWLLCLIYVICVALRLARFNVNSNQEPSWRDNFFEGVPSPAGAILVLTPLIFSLSGFVTTENNGGFVRLAHRPKSVDKAVKGIRFMAKGNNEAYEIHVTMQGLRMPPWAYHSSSFDVNSEWKVFEINFSESPGLLLSYSNIILLSYISLAVLITSKTE